MRSSRGRTSSSPPRPAKSSSTTRRSSWRTATAGRGRSRKPSRSRRPTGERHCHPGEGRDLPSSRSDGRSVDPGLRRNDGDPPMILQLVVFYIFAVVAVASGVMVVAARNPVHSVLFLILAFFNSAGLFVLLGAEFLAMILVIVYVGAVAVCKQRIPEQLARTRAEAVEVVKVPLGGGAASAGD